MEQAKRISRLMSWVATLGLVLVVSGCAMTAGPAASPSVSAVATANSTIAATPTLHPIAAFTCAAGSLPVRAPSTRTSCSVSTHFGATVLRATYAASSSSGPTVDENALTTAGWKLAMAAHGDGAVTSGGYAVYIYQSAWFAYQWSGTFGLAIQTSVSPRSAPIPCGQTLAAGSTQPNGMVLPSESFPLWDGNGFVAPMALAPACAADIQKFFETSLLAAGWHEDLPFLYDSRYPDAKNRMSAVFVRGSAQATIATAEFPSLGTFISVSTNS